jgi:ribosomal protein S18 acetylase RimI-like enzyme
MEIRPVQPADLALLCEIDGTIDSSHYVHVDRIGDALDMTWKLQQRPLRERRVLQNPIDDEVGFWLKQISSGADEGISLLIEHDAVPVALVVASQDYPHKTMKVHDIRVDFDHRRQGLAMALLFQVIAMARQAECRAVAAELSTDNFPAAELLSKCGFEVAGLDTRRRSNHDLVKEAVTLFWYAPLD